MKTQRNPRASTAAGRVWDAASLAQDLCFISDYWLVSWTSAFHQFGIVGSHTTILRFYLCHFWMLVSEELTRVCFLCVTGLFHFFLLLKVGLWPADFCFPQQVLAHLKTTFMGQRSFSLYFVHGTGLKGERVYYLRNTLFGIQKGSTFIHRDTNRWFCV